MPSQRRDTAVLGEVAMAGVALVTGDTYNVQAIRCMQQVAMVTRFLAHLSFDWEKSSKPVCLFALQWKFIFVKIFPDFLRLNISTINIY